MFQLKKIMKEKLVVNKQLNIKKQMIHRKLNLFKIKFNHKNIIKLNNYQKNKIKRRYQLGDLAN